MLLRVLPLVLLLTILAACGGGADVEPSESPDVKLTEETSTEPIGELSTEAAEEPTKEPTEEPVSLAPLTGEPLTDDSLYDRPVVAVKIDNDARARPQVGLNEADVVFVEPIEGLTRLVAIFHSRGTGEVGPVRSGRRVDPKLFGAFNPIFAFSGAAGPNFPAIDAGFPNTVVNDRDQTNWRREGTRRAPHNLFITLETIRQTRPDAPGSGAGPAFAFAAEQPAGGTDIDGFVVDYGRFRTASGWTWVEGTGWERSQDGSPHTTGQPDGSATRTVIADNVVVLTVETTRSQVEPITVEGAGPARIHRGGQMFEGTWTKQGVEDQFTFTTLDGAVLPLAPGSTWLEVHPTSGTYTPGAPAVSTE